MTPNILDVSQLEPCEPLERILASIPKIKSGEYLHVLHRMTPEPLFPILTKKGYTWHMQAGKQVPIELFIWRDRDTTAAKLVQENTSKHPK
ncbi:MAG: DUF2249 domain-containing protein [Thiomargarita sp.]|nr:DUF2249 domain-containing protein [Thiomargarita sp.]